MRVLDDLVLPKEVDAACRQVLAEHHRADLLRAHNMEPRHRLLLTGLSAEHKRGDPERV